MLFARRAYSIILSNYFAETKQKYQINPQLSYRSFIILHIDLFHLPPITATAKLEAFIDGDPGIA
jgi:hypothetical protein